MKNGARHGFACLLCVTALLVNSGVQAATLKAGTCKGISTSSGYKYVGTYCVDFACTVVTDLIFDTYCPHSVDLK